MVNRFQWIIQRACQQEIGVFSSWLVSAYWIRSGEPSTDHTFQAGDPGGQENEQLRRHATSSDPARSTVEFDEQTVSDVI